MGNETEENQNENLAEAQEPAALSENTGGDLSPSESWFSRWAILRDKPPALERVLLGLAGICTLLLIWFLLTRGDEPLVKPLTLPSPKATFDSLGVLFERDLIGSILASLGRVLGGFLLAALVAIPVGVIASCYPRLDAFLRPLSVFGRSIPIAALIPLTMMWFGLGETQKILFIFLASVAFIFFDTTQSVFSVSSRFLDTAKTLGAQTLPKKGALRAVFTALGYGLLFALATGLRFKMSDENVFEGLMKKPALIAGTGGALLGFFSWWPIFSSQAIHKVLFPLALPRIVNSLRLLFGLAFGYIMLAEVINAKLGVGHLINQSQRIGPREHIFLCLIIISLLAFGIDRLVFAMQKRFFPYEENVGS